MNKKILAILAILMMTMLPMTALAGSQGYSVSIVVVENNGFTVTLTPGHTPPETSLRFSGKQGNTDINATGQNSTTPWARINNTGDYTRNFNISLGQALPAGITLNSSDVAAMTGKIPVDTTIRTLVGGASLAPLALLNVYIKADYAASIPSCTSFPCTNTNTLSFRNYFPIATNLSVSGASSITVPDTSPPNATATYTVNGLLDQEGQLMTGSDGTITWSLASPKVGVSINSGTGIVDVSSTATAGTITVVATGSTLTGRKTVTISCPSCY